jgi:hypothetical protein
MAFYVLGNVMYANKVLHPFGLREDEIIQHVAIFGRSGAGKTNTMFQIIDNFLDHKKPFLIFDWKRNYRDLLAVRKNDEILVYTVGRDTAPLVFNPLIPPEGTNASVWLKKLIEIIAHSYYLGEGVMYLLQEAIHAVYIEYGVYSRMGAPAPAAEIPAPADGEETESDTPGKELPDGEKALLVDVMQYPLSGVVERYLRLGVSRRKGTTWKETCVQRDVIIPVDIPTRSGRTTLLQISEGGKRVLRELGHEVPDRSR